MVLSNILFYLLQDGCILRTWILASLGFGAGFWGSLASPASQQPTSPKDLIPEGFCVLKDCK